MKSITVLGSTGSIGTQTLEIVDDFPDRFRVQALTGGRNLALLVQQIRKYKPEVVAIADESLLQELKDRLAGFNQGTKSFPKLLAGIDGLNEAASSKGSDLVVTGIVGLAGLLPTISAIRAGKDIALANKETLIAAAPVVLPELKKSGSRLLPADSEHSAIFQCLQGTPSPENAFISTGVPTPGLKGIQLTASGGAFRDWPIDQMKRVTVKDAISHPNWSMGKKITVDSATLMNKGLEVIEAHYLFGIDYDHIEIVIHPQSIIHSMIEMSDSSVLAQLGWPDMKLPILYCMSWPDRMETPWKKLDLAEISELNFYSPDVIKYPCMNLAYSVGRAGGTMPAVLNAANEEAVSQFLDNRIHFLDIPRLIENTCEKHKSDISQNPNLDEIIAIDDWARKVIRSELNI